MPVQVPSAEAVYAAMWDSLARGAASGQHALHLMTVATVDAGGRPKARTVVTRGVDAATSTVMFHTDARSPKWAELAARPQVSIIWYDRESKEQIRAEGVASVHAGDALARARWEASRPDSRVCYAGVVGSSRPVDAPPHVPTDPDIGWPNFGVVVVTLTAMEWLRLVHSGHQRLRFEISEGRVTSSTWLVP